MENLFNISYLVVGFKNKNEYATLYKEFKTEKRARLFINRVKEDFELIILRKEESFYKNSDTLDISISTVREQFVKQN